MKITNLLLVVLFISMSSFAKANKEAKCYNLTTKSTELDQVSDGEKLIAKLDCVGCHNKSMKIVGPSYSDIAKKYPNNEKSITYLTNKILKGGSGVWGSVPMIPHATLKTNEVRSIVKYILSLKK